MFFDSVLALYVFWIDCSLIFESRALCYFGKLLSFSYYLIFLPNFDRCPFDELALDVISTNGSIRLDVVFDGKSHSKKGFQGKVMEAVCSTFFYCGGQ